MCAPQNLILRPYNTSNVATIQFCSRFPFYMSCLIELDDIFESSEWPCVPYPDLYSADCLD